MHIMYKHSIRHLICHYFQNNSKPHITERSSIGKSWKCSDWLFPLFVGESVLFYRIINIANDAHVKINYIYTHMHITYKHSLTT